MNFIFYPIGCCISMAHNWWNNIKCYRRWRSRDHWLSFHARCWKVVRTCKGVSAGEWRSPTRLYIIVWPLNVPNGHLRPSRCDQVWVMCILILYEYSVWLSSQRIWYTGVEAWVTDTDYSSVWNTTATPTTSSKLCCDYICAYRGLIINV